MILVAYTDEHSGLRAYRAETQGTPPRPPSRGAWVLVAIVAAIITAAVLYLR